eukprot:4906771-Prorocentrum_lima.AAC.1
MDLSKITEAVAAIEKEMPIMADKDMAEAIGAASSQSAAKAAPAKALAEVIDAAKALSGPKAASSASTQYFDLTA